jgi:hypothetical protein
MPAVFHERFLCTRRAQASEQEWQPMQRSMRGVVRIFKAGSFRFLKMGQFSKRYRILDAGYSINTPVPGWLVHR